MDSEFHPLRNQKIATVVLENQRFDVIITNMTRGDDHEAGLKFVDALHKSGNQAPIIIYSATFGREHHGQEKQFGVQEITNEPSVVYSLTVSDVHAAHQAREAKSSG
jgi:DNA-binding NtrC family response regulator